MVVIIKCGKCGYTGPALEHSEKARYECMKCNTINEVTNVPLKEWLGFNYKQYIPFILASIDSYNFKELAGLTPEEISAGKLSKTQINKLRGVLKTSFEEGNSIKKITSDIKKNVKVKDLKVEYTRGDKVISTIIPAARRNLAIARTESTRLANMGSADYYKSSGVQKYSWVATFGERTCEQCENLNGEVWEFGKGPQPPAHSLCRCTIVPEVELL